MTPYISFPNSFKRDLLAGKRLIGLWSSLASPIAMEVLGLAGYDWLLMDAEHSPNDPLTFVPQLMALKDSASAPVARPSSNDMVELKRLLDIGFYNFLIPFVETPEQARYAVAATRYPPQGVRGVSVSQRSNRYGTVPDYMKGINNEICVLVQIESRLGMSNVREIAKVEGVDGIFIGPSDLAAAMGHLGNPKHPEVQEAIKHLFGEAKACGKASGILAPVEEDARRYIEWGVGFIAVGSDLGVFKNATQGLRDRF